MSSNEIIILIVQIIAALGVVISVIYLEINPPKMGNH